MSNLKKQIIIVIFFILTFSAGIFTGFFIVDYLNAPYFFRPSPPPLPEDENMRQDRNDADRRDEGHPRFLKMLKKKLDLTETQMQKIDALFKTQKEKIKKIHKSIGSKFKQIREETKKELEKILTPDQLKNFEKLRNKKHSKRNRNKLENDREYYRRRHQ